MLRIIGEDGKLCYQSENSVKSYQFLGTHSGCDRIVNDRVVHVAKKWTQFLLRLHEKVGGMNSFNVTKDSRTFLERK